jgi:hypothetical protein
MLPVFAVLPYAGIMTLLWFDWFEFAILPVEWSSLSLSNISFAASAESAWLSVDW